VRVFASGKHAAQVVAGMAGFAFRQIAVVEVEVSYQRAIVKSGAIGCGASAADQGATSLAAELLGMGAELRGDRAAQGADRTTERIQHADFQLTPCGAGKAVTASSGDEGRQPLCIRHGGIPLSPLFRHVESS